MPIKSVEQQAILTLHRVRQGFIEERTATINRIRGLLAEFGIVLPQRAIEVRRGAAVHLERLPTLVASAIRDLLAHIQGLETRVGQYERELEAHTRADPRAQRIRIRLPSTDCNGTVHSNRSDRRSDTLERIAGIKPAWTEKLERRGQSL